MNRLWSWARKWVESETTVVVLSPQMPLWRAAKVALASAMATARAPSRVRSRLGDMADIDLAVTVVALGHGSDADVGSVGLTRYRAYSRAFLRTVPFLRNSNDFVFDTELIAQAVAFGLRVVEVPIHTRYFAEASSTSMKANLRYGFGTLWVMARYRLHRAKVLRSPLFQL